MDAYRVAFNTWQEKTEWVQKDKRFDILLPWGKHRADVLKEYIDHLEAKCAALAAELRSVEAIHNEAVFITDEHYEQCPPEVQKIIRSLAVMQIPAYQAFLAEVLAQGVEMMAAEADQLMDEFGDDSYKVMATADLQRFANAFAAQLRKGVQS